MQQAFKLAVVRTATIGSSPGPSASLPTRPGPAGTSFSRPPTLRFATPLELVEALADTAQHSPMLPDADVDAVLRRAAELQRAVLATVEVVKETRTALAALSAAIDSTPGIDVAADADLRQVRLPLADIQAALLGDATIRKRQEPVAPSTVDRINRVMEAHWSSSSAATTTHRRNYEIASDALTEILIDLRPLIEVDLVALQRMVERAGGPWTPGSGLPTWPPVD